jgi:hypothetical protein
MQAGSLVAILNFNITVRGYNGGVYIDQKSILT